MPSVVCALAPPDNETPSASAIEAAGSVRLEAPPNSRARTEPRGGAAANVPEGRRSNLLVAEAIDAPVRAAMKEEMS